MLHVRTRFQILGLTIAILAPALPADACSVCFGDPESPMAKGALMGVLTLGAVIVSVLIMVAGTTLFWLRRGMQLSRATPLEIDSD